MLKTVSVKVSAAMACFTRPEAKVERVSYMCMTPSAARGVLEAIVWKPQFEWVVHAITVLNPIQFISIRRNEIQDTIPVRGKQGVDAWQKDAILFRPYFADSAGRKSPYGDHRVQRHTLALRDVAYVITAEPKLTAKANQSRLKPHDDDEPQGADTVEKYVGMFNRRLEKGQCFQQPYLGLREFVADFLPVVKDDAPDAKDSILSHDRYELGRMFFDYQYPDDPDGKRIPLYSPAFLCRGVLNVDMMRRELNASHIRGGVK